MSVYVGLCNSTIFSYSFGKLVSCYSIFCVFRLFLFWIRYHLYRPHNICVIIVYMGAKFFVILFSLWGPSIMYATGAREGSSRMRKAACKGGKCHASCVHIHLHYLFSCFCEDICLIVSWIICRNRIQSNRIC